MMETDDKLLNQFFTEQKKEIEDKGFSRRVMRSLPGRRNRLNQLWTAFCTVLAILLFFAFDGLQATMGTLREVFISMIQQEAAGSFDPRSLIIAAVVLLFMGIRKIWSLA